MSGILFCGLTRANRWYYDGCCKDKRDFFGNLGLKAALKNLRLASTRENFAGGAGDWREFTLRRAQALQFFSG